MDKSRIILVRHGPVALKAPGLLSFMDFHRYCDAYEHMGLARGAHPTRETLAAVQSAAYVFSSLAPRAVDSVHALEAHGQVCSDPIFGEEPNVAPRLPGRWPLIMWFSLSRGAGAFAPARNARRAAMRARAREAARILSDAATDAPTALVGHGWFNRAIARALTESGWRVAEPSRASNAMGSVARPWGYAVYAPPSLPRT